MKYSVEKLREILLNTKKTKEKIALCHGCFDGLHKGHLELFKKAKEVANIIIVGVESDDYIKRVKGEGRPFHKLRSRVAAITNTSLVDYVFVIPQGNYKIYKKLYMDLKPDYLVTAVDDVYPKKKKDAAEAKVQLIADKEKKHHSRDRSPTGFDETK